MNLYQAGQFYGEKELMASFDGLTVIETKCDYEVVNWHYHENSYFSFVTLGGFGESNRHETYSCPTGTLLFHNAQQPHSNVKPPGISRCFQLEMSERWLNKFEIDLDKLPSNRKIVHPSAKLLFYNIYKEAKLTDDTSNLTVDALLLETFEIIRGVEHSSVEIKPLWVKKIDEILHEDFDQPLSLQKLSDELNLHFAHLSRDFPRYFHCNFSQYIRKIKVEKSLDLLRQRNLSLTEIAFSCGFADQSHFIRCFKEFHGITPKKFRQIIL